MAVVLKDRVKETTSTAGTADFVLGGASSGYQAFSVIGPNNYTYYCCFDNATGAWEVGYGQYTTTAGGTLVRDTILSNSAATTSKIDFAAGPKDVFITYPAEKAIYEEDAGNVLIDGGPITVIGNGVTGYTTFSAALGEMYGDVNQFAQFYAQNLNDGTEASADMIVYRDNTVVDTANFMDMGINSSNFSSATWPIFTPSSMYLYGDGGEMFIGSGTDDVVFFTGGVDVTDEAARFDKTTKALTTVADVNVGGALDVTGAATFGSTVLLDADPTLALQAATKQYVDNAVSNGFHVHTPVLVATTANLTATYSNGSSGVGATLTNSGSQAALAIDGVSMATNDRVLVWAQSTQAQNGVYVVTTVGNGSTNWVLTRASDADTYAPQSDTGLGGGDYFFVQSGTTYGFSSFVCTNDGTITFGSTAITFQLFSTVPSYVVTAPLNLTGNTLSLSGTVAATNGGTGTNTVTTGDLLYGSASNTWSKLAAGSAYKSLVMNAGGTNVEWNAVALNQSGAVSGALPAINGGTGQNAYALGDTLYSDATNSVARLAGNTTTTKKFLGQTGTGSASAAPSWQQPAATDITGLAASATTDTTNASNISSGTLGTARLSGSYTGITGVGTLAAGTWNGSVIGATYGGTGQSSYAVGDLLYASTTTALSKLADVAVGNALISGGVSSAPSWGKIGLATHVSGTLPIANGGTGSTSTQFVALGTNVSGTLPVANGGTGVTTSTGSGNVVLSTSPTLVTPALGTPSSGNLANCTFPTLNQNTTGSSGSCTGNAATVSSITGNTGLMTNRLTPASNIDGLTTANFRSTLFGTTTYAAALATARWDATPSVLSGLGNYGTMVAWGASDTQGFLAIDYSGANAKIGGGNGNNINWTATLIHSSNYTSYSPSLTGSGASGTWSINVSGSAGSVAASNISGQVGMWTSAARPGPYRLYRRDDNSDYSVQTNWNGAHWVLQGYSGDSYHAGCRVAYADSAGSAPVNTGVGEVGTYVIAMSTATLTGSGTSSIVAAGTTVAGSSLVRGTMAADSISPFSGNGTTLYSTVGNTTSNGLGGSWRQMTATKNNNTYIAMTLWVRYA